MRITRKIAEYSTRDKEGGLKTMAMNSLMEKIKTKFKNDVLISFIFDKNMITKYKDSPIDEGKEKFLQL